MNSEISLSSNCKDSFWRWPDCSAGSYPDVSVHKRQEVDECLEKVVSFWQTYRLLPDVEFRSDPSAQRLRTRSIAAWIPGSDGIVQGPELDWPSGLIVRFSKKQPLLSIRLVTETKIFFNHRSEIRLVINLSQGSYEVLKEAKLENEIQFLQNLFFYQSSFLAKNIHPVIDFIEEDSGKVYFLQKYCPKGDLLSFIEKKEIPLKLRLSLCCDAIFAVAFLHQFPRWEYSDYAGKEKVIRRIDRTSHFDIKLQNFLVDEERAVLIDDELVAIHKNCGTLEVCDLQKMQLMKLCIFYNEKNWDDLERKIPLLEPSFQNLQNRKLSSEEKQQFVYQFYEKYGQAHDIWALGLVLLSVIRKRQQSMSSFLGVCASSKKEFLSAALTQEEINEKLQHLEKEALSLSKHFSSLRFERQIVQIFRLIKGALTIDYQKRIDAASMLKVANRIQKSISCEKKGEPFLEDIQFLFA